MTKQRGLARTSFVGQKLGGFTLIELLVVIAIIGILSSVVLASLNSARVKARDARRVTDIKQIQIALELFYDAKSQYPTDIYAESGSIRGSADGASLPSVPKDPSDNSNYKYSYTPTTGSVIGYHIGAKMEQGNGATTLDDSDRDQDSTGATWAGSKFSGADTTDPWTYDVSNQ